MTMLVPKGRPAQSREETLAILDDNLIPAVNCVTLLGVRGYYKDSMGKRDQNDQGMYDDALFVISPTKYAAFNFNTDPQKAGFHLAKLDAGKYRFHKGLHKGKYKCLRPFPETSIWPCSRDGVKSMCGAIQIHKGGFDDTFSAGCQTIYPAQYVQAMPLIYAEMTKYNQSEIVYLLIDNNA